MWPWWRRWVSGERIRDSRCWGIKKVVFSERKRISASRMQGVVDGRGRRGRVFGEERKRGGCKRRRGLEVERKRVIDRSM